MKRSRAALSIRTPDAPERGNCAGPDRPLSTPEPDISPGHRGRGETLEFAFHPKLLRKIIVQKWNTFAGKSAL